MARNLFTFQVHEMIVNDFERAWDALAEMPADRPRVGNFMFARQAMVLLEWAARLCTRDKTGAALPSLAMALRLIDAKYFTHLPGDVPISRQVPLPTLGSPDRELLSALFDLIRHGQSHQYQQILVDLPDGHHFGVMLAAADHNLEHLRQGLRPNIHLGMLRDEERDLWIVVCPDVLFFDFKRAVEMSGLLSRVGEFPYLGRKGKHYRFSVDELEETLRQADHQPVRLSRSPRVPGGSPS